MLIATLCGFFSVDTPRATAADAESALFPPELVRFQPYANNPVFTAGPAGSWDSKIRERGWILREGNQYRLWYSGYNGTDTGQRKLGYATSPDGFNWTRYAHNPIYDRRWIEDMMVLKHAGTYYMFAEGLDDRAEWLTSLDGIQWRRQGTLEIRYTNGRPLSPGPFGTPFVWRMDDGTWRLTYERGDSGVWLARSADLKTWTNVQDEAVLKPGPREEDRLLIAVNQVLRYEGRYYAYYHGSGSTTKPRLWTSNLAASQDLLHWIKYPHNPLVPGNKSSNLVVPEGKKFRLYTMHDRVDVYLPP